MGDGPRLRRPAVLAARAPGRRSGRALRATTSSTTATSAGSSSTTRAGRSRAATRFQLPSAQTQSGEGQFDFLERVAQEGTDAGKVVFVVMHMPTQDPGDQSYRDPIARMHTMGKGTSPDNGDVRVDRGADRRRRRLPRPHQGPVPLPRRGRRPVLHRRRRRRRALHRRADRHRPRVLARLPPGARGRRADRDRHGPDLREGRHPDRGTGQRRAREGRPARGVRQAAGLQRPGQGRGARAARSRPAGVVERPAGVGCGCTGAGSCHRRDLPAARAARPESRSGAGCASSRSRRRSWDSRRSAPSRSRSRASRPRRRRRTCRRRRGSGPRATRTCSSPVASKDDDPRRDRGIADRLRCLQGDLSRARADPGHLGLGGAAQAGRPRRARPARSCAASRPAGRRA